MGDRGSERRSERRYPIAVELDYRIVHRKKVVASGYGRVMNISSSGILIESGCALRPGQDIELTIPWPALLNNVAPLKLWIGGRTVRCQDTMTAIKILRYEFRLRASSKTPLATALPGRETRRGK